MDDLPRRKLRELIAKHGRDLCEDRRRCEGLLRDVCGSSKRELNLLLMALKEGVATDLAAARTGVPAAVLHARLTQRMQDHLSIAQDAARWAVESWALALGLQIPSPPAEADDAGSERTPVTKRRDSSPPAEPVKVEVPPVKSPPAKTPARKGPSAGDFLQRGNAHYEKREYDRAIAEYDQAIKLDPSFADAFNNRGNAYDGKGEYARAIEDFDRALRIAPRDASFLNNRGVAYYNKGDNDRAIADYDQAIALDPSYVLAFSNRGNVFRRKEMYDRAIQDYDRAIELDPNNAGAFNNRGNAYRDKEMYERAMQDYDRALQIDPNHARAIQNKRDLQSQVNRISLGVGILVAVMIAIAIAYAYFKG